jgi:hypothetical protein
MIKRPFPILRSFRPVSTLQSLATKAAVKVTYKKRRGRGTEQEKVGEKDDRKENITENGMETSAFVTSICIIQKATIP